MHAGRQDIPRDQGTYVCESGVGLFGVSGGLDGVASRFFWRQGWGFGARKRGNG